MKRRIREWTMPTIDLLITEYVRHLESIGQSPYTVKNAKTALKRFAGFLRTLDIQRVEGINPDVLESYQHELCFDTGNRGRRLAVRTQTQLLGVVKGFTRFLKTRHYFVADPGKVIRLPKKPKQLPRVILTSEEISRIVLSPNTATNSGYRDRVVLELLYDTAIRRSELSAVQIKHMDLEGGYIHIHGKGDRQRVVPVSKRVCDLAANYIQVVRPQCVALKDSGHLILNRFGNQMGPNGIWAIVKRHAKEAGIRKNVSTHTFRHTCATHMMKNGAPVRHIQELLGHESLESTQIYTRVTINDLKRVHKRFHPGNRLEKRNG